VAGLRRLGQRARTYPAEYRRAAQARRRIRAAGSTPVDALAVSRALGLGPTQADEEILRLAERVAAERPRVVVEIGTDEGGTLLLWTCVAADDALVVAIDARPLGLLGRLSAWAFLRRGFARGRQRVALLMGVDSHSPRTLDRLRALLGDRPIDFLFIDGDHSYDGVKQDFEMYGALVRPGGLIALHDTIDGAEPEVVRFWNELKQRTPTEEWVAPNEPRYGIGLHRVRA